MSAAREYAIPPALPDELLAELDAAVRSLGELALRHAELSLELDEQTGALVIRLEDENGSRPITPGQLFELL